jgi:hypothetical protein
MCASGYCWQAKGGPRWSVAQLPARSAEMHDGCSVTPLVASVAPVPVIAGQPGREDRIPTARSRAICVGRPPTMPMCWEEHELEAVLVLFTPDSLALALREAGFSGVELVRSRPSAAWHLEESAKLAGLGHRRPLAALARVLNGASYVRPALSDEMTFIATRA